MSGQLKAFFTSHTTREEADQTAEEFIRLSPFVKDAFIKNMIMWLHEYEEEKIQQGDKNSIKCCNNFREGILESLSSALQVKKSSIPAAEQLFVGLESQITRELLLQHMLEETKGKEPPTMEIMFNALSKTCKVLGEKARNSELPYPEGMWVAHDIKTMTDMLPGLVDSVKKEKMKTQFESGGMKKQKNDLLEKKIAPVVESFNANFSNLNLSLEDSLATLIFGCWSALSGLSRKHSDLMEVCVQIFSVQKKLVAKIFQSEDEAVLINYSNNNLSVWCESFNKDFKLYGLNVYGIALSFFMGIIVIAGQLNKKYPFLDELIQIAREHSNDLTNLIVDSENEHNYSSLN